MSTSCGTKKCRHIKNRVVAAAIALKIAVEDEDEQGSHIK
jgi:hypothetical protein